MTDYRIKAEGFQVNITMGNVKGWISSTYAPAWYSDAVEQSKLSASRDSIRREITFAVCAIESYLLEWVRDEVLKHDYEELEKYFPAGEARPVMERWKEVIKKLAAEDEIPKSQEFGKMQVWNDVKKLVDFRKGLVHARSSRPHGSDQADNLQPYPSQQDLTATKPGWAVSVVRALFQDLHKTVGTESPAWLGCS